MVQLQTLQKDHLVNRGGSQSRLQPQVVIHLQLEGQVAPMALLALQMSMHMNNIHEEVREYQIFLTRLAILHR